jgi:hypothetical protein
VYHTFTGILGIDPFTVPIGIGGNLVAVLGGFGGVALTSLLVADMELELKPTVTQARVIDIIKDDMIAKENKTAAVKFIQVPTFYSVPICASNSSYLPIYLLL